MYCAVFILHEHIRKAQAPSLALRRRTRHVRAPAVTRRRKDFAPAVTRRRKDFAPASLR